MARWYGLTETNDRLGEVVAPDFTTAAKAAAGRWPLSLCRVVSVASYEVEADEQARLARTHARRLAREEA